jgi:hypothetical protein
MNLGQLKQKLNDENEKLAMYVPIPRTSSISMSSHLNTSDIVFTGRNYELDDCYYQPKKTIPFTPKPSNNKDDWNLLNIISEDQDFFINKISEMKVGFYENMFKHDQKNFFTIIRNPINRLFSIWNYCTNSEDPLYALFSIQDRHEDYKIYDFNDFVKLIYDTKKIPDKYPEKMFLKMSDILDIKLGTKLTIYKFEEIPDCIETLKNEFFIDGNYKYHNQSNKSIEKNITQETKEFIYELYKEDFENFNYDINNIEEPTPTMPSLTSNNSSGYEEALKLFQIAEQEVLTEQK